MTSSGLFKEVFALVSPSFHETHLLLYKIFPVPVRPFEFHLWSNAEFCPVSPKSSFHYPHLTEKETEAQKDLVRGT